jgi:hypothetical protein
MFSKCANLLIQKSMLGAIAILFVISVSYNDSLGDNLSATCLPQKTVLSGKTLELKDNILSFLCDDGSIANVKWHEVVSLVIDDKIYVTLNKEETFFGLVTIRDGKVTINSQTVGKISFSSQQITSLERKRKDVSPVFVVSQPQNFASVRAKGTETPPRPSYSNDEKLTEKEEKQTKPEKKTPTIGEKPSERIPEEMFLREEKVLVPKGKGEVELNLTFINRDRSAVFLGPDKVRALVPSITARYGITNNLLGFVTVPFVVSWRELQPSILEATKNYRSSGLGDIFFGANYQVFNEGYWRPSLMLSFIVTSPTGKSSYVMPENREPLGKGHWQLSPGISVVKSIDPVVLFGNLYYTYIFSRIINQPPELGPETERVEMKPGDSINLLLGTGFALNEKVTLSFKVVGSYIFRDKIAGKEIGGTKTPGYFYFLLDYMLFKKGYLEPSVGFGITKDASDFLLSLSYVHRFY